VIRMDEGKKKNDGRENESREREDKEQQTHLCQHNPISRRDIDYERVVRLEDVGSDERVFGFGCGVHFSEDLVKKVSFTLQGGGSRSVRIGLDKGK